MQRAGLPLPTAAAGASTAAGAGEGAGAGSRVSAAANKASATSMHVCVYAGHTPPPRWRGGELNGTDPARPGTRLDVDSLRVCHRVVSYAGTLAVLGVNAQLVPQVDHAVRWLRGLVDAGRHIVEPVFGQHMAGGEWRRHTAVLVFPDSGPSGYASVPAFVQREVESFMEAGGSVLGLCAGAEALCKHTSSDAVADSPGAVGVLAVTARRVPGAGGAVDVKLANTETGAPVPVHAHLFEFDEDAEATTSAVVATAASACVVRAVHRAGSADAAAVLVGVNLEQATDGHSIAIARRVLALMQVACAPGDDGSPQSSDLPAASWTHAYVCGPASVVDSLCTAFRRGASSLSAWGTSVGFDGIADVDGVCVHKGYVVVACRVLHSVRYLM